MTLLLKVAINYKINAAFGVVDNGLIFDSTRQPRIKYLPAAWLVAQFPQDCRRKNYSNII